MILTQTCNRASIGRFLGNRMDLDEKLDFLGHLQECKQCWGEVYNARKNEHPHYYKKTARRLKVSQKELDRLNNNTGLREDTEEEAYQPA